MLPRAWDTASAALCACARALGDERDVAAIAAASGLAFRISVDDEVSLAGPHAYPFAEVLPQAAARLGYDCELVASSERPESPLHAAARRRALDLVRRGLAAGRPTLIWGVHAPEFGLAIALDGERLCVSGILDGAAPDTLEAPGLGDVPIVLALQLTGKLAVADDDAALWAALQFGRGPTPSLSGFHSGAAAWRAVEAALASGRVDPAGLAYAAQRWAESRAAAAAWLAAHPRRVELADAARAFLRAAGMLSELASLHPFPPEPGAMLTSSAREQSAELVAEAARAESAGLDAIAQALVAGERRAADALVLVDLDERTRPLLYSCARELPVVVDEEVALCRAHGRPRGKLLFDGDRLVGHVLWAPLDEARQPVVAQGRRWFVHCPWVLHALRGRGAGPRLYAALEAEARAAGIDGLLTFATDDPRFLYVESLRKLGFSDVARRGELYLLERALTDSPSYARFADSPPSETRVFVGQTNHCPLLLHTRRALASSARELGLPVEESASAAAGARIDGRELPWGYVPAAALTAHLKTL